MMPLGAAASHGGCAADFDLTRIGWLGRFRSPPISSEIDPIAVADRRDYSLRRRWQRIRAPGASITGTGSAPGTGPGDAQLYFPLAAGDIWFYEATNDDSAAPTAVGELTSTVNGTKTVQGVVATVLTHANTTVSGGAVDGYYTSAGGGVTYWGNSNPTDTLTPLIVPYVQLLFPIQTGTVSSIVGKNLTFGTDGAGNQKTLDLTQTIVNAGFESISVAAGTFPNALKPA